MSINTVIGEPIWLRYGYANMKRLENFLHQTTFRDIYEKAMSLKNTRNHYLSICHRDKTITIKIPKPLSNYGDTVKMIFDPGYEKVSLLFYPGKSKLPVDTYTVPWISSIDPNQAPWNVHFDSAIWEIAHIIMHK